MTAIRNNRARKAGFTLIEILIVVIILGILAAIVIPQFSSASNDARRSNVQTTAQTLRSQIALFRLQHQDRLPPISSGGNNFWDYMTKYSNEAFTTLSTAKDTTNGVKYGPYMQQAAPNALNSSTVVVDGTTNASSSAGYVYDYNGGNGSGQIWGTDTDSTTLVKP